MTSFRTVARGLLVLACLLIAVPASAQAGRISGSINFGMQGGSDDFTQRVTPTIYDEAASLDIAQTAESGPLFDLGGSYLAFGNIGFGLSYSRTSGDGTAAIAAQIPDPLSFLRPARAASASADGLEHSEHAVHLQVFYRFAASPKLDVSVGVGPTFFSVNQELVETVDVTESGATPAITPRVVEASDSPVGVHIGADITYMVNERFGAGVLLRYATGSADLTTPNGTNLSLDAGGFQFGAGLRVRF